MEKDLISVIVPVYNVEKYITETCDCVLAQTYTRWELILVEDGSTDDTLTVIKEYLKKHPDAPIRLISKKEKLGAAGARNLGVKEARGRYISYLDADDVWVPDKLQKELEFMQEKNAAFVFTGYEFADENAKGLGKVVKVPSTINYKQALKNTTIFTSTVMFDREKLETEKLMMPQIRSEDTALWWSVLRGGVIAYGLNENLVLYRRSGNSLSSNKLKAISRIWNLYRRAEGMNVFASAWYFCFWAFRAVKRRV